jgi:hypothetical protein
MDSKLATNSVCPFSLAEKSFPAVVWPLGPGSSLALTRSLVRDTRFRVPGEWSEAERDPGPRGHTKTGERIERAAPLRVIRTGRLILLTLIG